MKSLRDWAKELNVEHTTLSRWITGKRKAPDQFRAILPLIQADLKPHKSLKFGTKILAPNSDSTKSASSGSALNPFAQVRTLARQPTILRSKFPSSAHYVNSPSPDFGTKKSSIGAKIGNKNFIEDFDLFKSPRTFRGSQCRIIPDGEIEVCHPANWVTGFTILCTMR